MKEHALRIELTFQAPILTHSSSPGVFGQHASMARVEYGLHEGRPCIHGTLVKGKLAEAFEVFEQLCKGTQTALFENFRRDWLGESSPPAAQVNASSVDPYRGRLVLGDFVVKAAQDTAAPNGLRYRISIDEHSGTVKDQMLLAAEMPFASGEDVVFEGHAWFFSDVPENIRDTVASGLSFLTQFGAQRTTGFGRLRSITVTLDDASARSTSDITRSKNAVPASGEQRTGDIATPVSVPLRLEPLGPFSIPKHKIGDNFLESGTTIPGNVIAGALVETWSAMLGCRVPPAGIDEGFDSKRPELGKHFSRIRFRHAFPTSERSRPQAVPLSLAAAENEYFDLAEHGVACVLAGNDGKVQAPSFRVDWKSKHFEHVDPTFGWASPAKELRVRTAIDSTVRRAHRGNVEAKGPKDPHGKLFALELVHPYLADKEKTPLTWQSRVDVPGSIPKEERDAMLDQLRELFSVLSFVGKTKARFKVDAFEPQGATALPEIGPTLRLVLQTPALLGDPRFQNVDGVPRSGALTQRELHALYEATWFDLSGGAIGLRHFFATQSLAGGSYLYGRFQRRWGRPYRPWLLTDAGSVFSFKVLNAAKLMPMLQEWLQLGLPVPAWASDVFGDTWERNPYIRSNGFGEVALHEYVHFHPPAREQHQTINRQRAIQEAT